MKYFATVIVLLIFFGCRETSEKTIIPMDNSIELFNTFDKDNHLKPDFDKVAFDTLHSWDFGWAILKPINQGSNDEREKLLSKRLSPGQKALYFFWYLDAQVTNGGFIQFYWNGYRQYLPPIIDGLELINDKELLSLFKAADLEYLANQEKFELQQRKDDWEPLYDNLKKFDELDDQYYKIHTKTMELIEKYARQNPQEFVNLK